MELNIKQLAKEMDEVLDTLPVDIRLTMHLHFIEGLGLTEISFILNVSLRQVRRHINGGFRLLAKYMINNDGLKVDRNLLTEVLTNISKVSVPSTRSLLEAVY